MLLSSSFELCDLSEDGFKTVLLVTLLKVLGAI